MGFDTRSLSLSDHILFPFFLSMQNGELLENGGQFLLTAISQVFSTLSGPEVTCTVSSPNLLQVTRNKDRPKSFGERTGFCLFCHHSDLPEWVSTDGNRASVAYVNSTAPFRGKFLGSTFNKRV